MIDKYQKSNALLKRAKKVTPLGAQTFSKSYRYYCEENSPAFIERGEGAYVFDVDGNKFIDFVCALGPITIGYNDERINNAVINQLKKGIIFSQQAEVEVLLAEKISEVIPCAEMVRFVKNGSDATTAAIRLARAYTKRDIVAVSGYHGMHDWYIGSTENDKGIPKVVGNLTKSFIYNDLDSLKNLFKQYPNQISAVILEPIQADGPKEDYLKNLKELVSENGALLIFDEVVSGFRYALGGAAELYNVVPDMVTFGKGMGNGMPISAVAGKTEILKLIEEGVFISTTFGGEALSMAASLEVIKILEKKESFDKIWKLGNIMLEGLNNLVAKYNMQNILKVSGLAPHCGLIFEGIRKLDYLDINSIFSQTMIEEGIITVGINNINLSHTKEDIEHYLNAVEKAILKIKEAIKDGTTSNILKGKKVDPIFKRNIK